MSKIQTTSQEQSQACLTKSQKYSEKGHKDIVKEPQFADFVQKTLDNGYAEKAPNLRDDDDLAKPLVHYRMCVHVFGNMPSPSVATYGLGKAVNGADEGVMEAFPQEDLTKYIKDLDLRKYLLPLQTSRGLGWGLEVDTFLIRTSPNKQLFTILGFARGS